MRDSTQTMDQRLRRVRVASRTEGIAMQSRNTDQRLHRLRVASRTERLSKQQLPWSVLTYCPNKTDPSINRDFVDYESH